MSRDYRQYLEDILAAIQKIDTYVQGVSFEQFSNDSMRVDAVLHNLQIIGEAAKSIPDDIKEHHPTVEWRKITGLRDIIAHKYFGINLQIIWDIVENKLPEFKQQIAILFEDEA